MSEQLTQGVEKWSRNGWTTLKIHFTADPNKRGDWAEKHRGGYSSQAWAQEQEVDFTIQPGTPIFCDTGKIDDRPQNYSPGLPLVSGLDYSFLANVCLTGQVRKREDGRFELRVLSETLCEASFIQPFRDKVLAERARWFGGHASGFVDYGDYAANQRTATGVLIDEIRPIELITVPTGPGGVRKGIEVVQYLISQGLLCVDPSCVGLLRALRGAYVWAENKLDATGAPVPSGVHPFADFADALRYLCINLFELRPLETGGQEVTLKGQYRGDSWTNGPTEKILTQEGTGLQSVKMQKVDLHYGSPTRPRGG